MFSIPKILTSADYEFPPVSLALQEPNGLLAIGGSLSSKQLLNAYSQGIFPWYNSGEPILWWSPDPRAVLFLDELKISRSLKKVLRNRDYQITYNQAFFKVIQACATIPRANQPGTWISEEMIEAYQKLHQADYARSVEVWENSELIGGLYGVDLGHIFCGESMFSLKPNASKIALVYLVGLLKESNYLLIDCQIMNPYLASLGARDIPRTEFIKLIKK